MKKLIVLASLLLLALSLLAQTPDPSKIPHYFGPYPNWANSPLTMVDAKIQFGTTNSCGGTGVAAVASVDANGAITGVMVTSQGSGYTCAPDVTISSTYGHGAAVHATFTPTAGFISSITLVNGGSNYFAPVVTITGNGTGATAEATTDPYTGAITGITLTNAGSGYTSATVDISDSGGTGLGASAMASVSSAVIAVVVDTPGSGYRTPGGIRKFVDTLPGLGPNGKNNLGQYVSVAHPDTITYPGADYYEVDLVEYSRKLHSDLSPTKLRGYVQHNYGTDGNGQNTIAPDATPQFLGATIVATKERPVRILFRNKLPTGAAGNLFLPVDTTLMGAGMGPDMGGMTETDNNSVYDGVRNPMCGVAGEKPMGCYSENRATLHLHGGITPWISDGTPHQWTVPAGEGTSYAKGVSVSYVPDMWFDASGNTIAECAGKTTCSVAGATNNPGDGALTFYYTNQQSARLLFYHDHAWGITRLNVYAGEAAGYLITDQTEQKLVAPGGALDASDPALGLGVPLVIQDRTFVPSTAQLAVQDPTWDANRWGGTGNFWYHHVYMPAQNPADPTGVSPYGRWMYGPWFWPPATSATTPYQPIPNPYYDAACDPATAPNGFCEPPQIPGTPNISVGMEQFNDTPLVNGTAYPTVTVDPKAYRFRILNAANDRFFNLQWYVADASGTEVALKASEVAAAQNDPNVFPTPDTTISPAGPSWVQIGSEGGFLPTPVTIPNQPITWITDPTRFDFGNVDQHSMLVAPAERADVIVDFSKYAGKTLILYNDAPAAFPARQASYDYYTGDPDNTDIGGAPSTVPGYGPNTRTVMQVKVNASSAVPSLFSLSKLITAFAHNAAGTGVFESGQHPVIVGQAGYNRAYGTSFAASGDCSKAGTTTKCDGFARINQQGGDPFTFDTLSGNKLAIPLQPKALHDEMNSSTFDEYGRMTANLGVEAVPATPAAQNVTLYPYVNPATEMIDASKLPSGGGIQIAPISTAADGTQIWKITHNGVDTHPIHFHLYDVQVINRVTWDNIIIPPDLNELGWKDTVRISPLEDTYVALRPVIPSLPFQLPNSIRPLNPMMPLGSTMMFNSIAPNGQATAAPITNDLVNFGWEYVWHCHILSHEEMDMMRPVSVAVPPSAPANLVAISDGNAVRLNWTDTSPNATSFTLQRASDPGFTKDWITWPLGHTTTYTDNTANSDTTYYYKVYASNTIGSTKESGFTTSPGGNSMPTMTVDSGYSNTATVVAGIAYLLSPADGATGVDPKNAVFTWTTAPGATAYYIWMGTSAGGNSVLSTGALSTTTLTRNNLQPNTSYYVRLWTIKGTAQYFSDTVFTTGAGSARLINPADGSVVYDALTATANWTSIQGATGYQLVIGTTQGAGNAFNSGTVTATSVNLTGLQPSSTYFARLYTYIGGSSTYADSTFTTGTAMSHLISPADGATGVDPNKAVFAWTPISDALTYFLYVGTAVGKNDVVSWGEVTATTYTASSLQPNTTYYVRLFTKKASGWYWVDTTFTTGIVRAQLTQPANGSVVYDALNATANWTTAPGATGYQLVIGTTQGGSNAFNSGTVTGTSVNLTGLLPSTSYFARLYTYSGANSAYVDSTFTTGTAMAHLITPASGATSVDPQNPVFAWTPISDALTYFLYVGTAVGKNDVVSWGEVTATAYTASNLQPNTTYYVRLFTKKASGWYWVDTTFTTGIFRAQLTQPANGSVVYDALNAPPAMWTTATGATGYQLVIGTTQGGSDAFNSGTVTGTSVNLTGLQPSTAYFARLYTFSGANSAYVDSTFTTNTALAHLITPANGATGVDPANAVFSWTPIADARSYFLFVGTAPGLNDVVSWGEVTSTTYTATNLQPATTYYVRLWTMKGAQAYWVDTVFTTK